MKKPRITRRVTIEVEFHHVDMLQVVHNSQYFKWFEKGRLQFLEEFCPVSYALANNIATPVVMNHCEYLSPAAYGDELVVTTRHFIKEQWDGRFLFEHHISNKKTKVELCHGETAVTVLDFKTGKLVKEIPEELWEKYHSLV